MCKNNQAVELVSISPKMEPIYAVTVAKNLQPHQRHTLTYPAKLNLEEKEETEQI